MNYRITLAYDGTEYCGWQMQLGQPTIQAALETVSLLCEPVEPPKGELEHIHYFCGNTEVEDDLKEHEPQRAALYKGTAAMLRAYANIADDLPLAGYTTGQAERIKGDVERYIKLREIIRQASGETIDLKAYEADIARADQLHEAAQGDLAAQQRTLYTQLSVFITEARNNQQLVNAYVTEVVPKSEKTVESLQNAWVSSKATLLDVLDARRALLEAHMEHQRALATWQVALQNLTALTGGFAQPSRP